MTTHEAIVTIDEKAKGEIALAWHIAKLNNADPKKLPKRVEELWGEGKVMSQGELTSVLFSLEKAQGGAVSDVKPKKKKRKKQG